MVTAILPPLSVPPWIKITRGSLELLLQCFLTACPPSGPQTWVVDHWRNQRGAAHCACTTRLRTRSPQVYTDYVTGLVTSCHPNGLNNTLFSQGHALENSSYCGNVEEHTFQGQGRGRSLPLPRSALGSTHGHIFSMTSNTNKWTKIYVKLYFSIAENSRLLEKI